MGLGLTVVAIAAIFAIADLATVGEALAGADPAFALAALGLFVAFQAARAQRLRVLTRSRRALPVMIAGVTLQGSANLVLPAGLGEAALVWLMQRLVGANLARNIAVVLMARVFDMLVLGAAAVGGALLLVPNISGALLGSAAVLFGIAVVLMTVGFWAGGARPRRRDRRLTKPWARRVLWGLYQARRAARAFRSPWRLLVVVGLSLGMWASFFGTYYCVVRALALPMTAGETLAVYLLSFPTNLMPIKTAGNVGVFEGVWVIILVLMGWDEATALNTAVAAHAGILAVLVVAAGLAAAAVALGTALHARVGGLAVPKE